MRRGIFVLVLGTLGLVAFSPRRSRSHSISDLAFMAGCWEMRAGDRVVEEHWMAPAAGMMLGMGRTLRAGKLVEFESTRIEQRGDSVIFFATPSGQTPSQFPAITSSSREIVFQDLGHDFPQRVIYRSAARGDSLLASVEGPMRGEMKVISFPMARVTCGGK